MGGGIWEVRESSGRLGEGEERGKGEGKILVTVKNRFKQGLRCGRQTLASREVTRERRGVYRLREERRREQGEGVQEERKD